MGLPELSGSVKQKEWARKIRKEISNYISEKIDGAEGEILCDYEDRLSDETISDKINEDVASRVGMYNEIRELLFSKNDAAWWIDNRLLIPDIIYQYIDDPEETKREYFTKK